MKRQLLGNHQNSWIWGTKAIAETIASGHWKILELHLLENSSAPHLMEWEAWAHRHRIPCERETAARLEQLCKARDHQGAIALMGPFPYTPFSQLRDDVEKGSRILILDGVQDPFNLGAMIRSAVAFGFDGILCSTHNQVGVTSHVARSSVGLVNRIAICRVEDLSASVQELKRCGVQLLTTHQQGICDVDQLSTNHSLQTRPLAIVLGSEAHGISDSLQELADLSIRIPMCEQAESLNVAVSAGILMHALRKTDA